MARYSDAVCRLCRREGEKLFLKGARCSTPKCALDRKEYVPGIHGRGKRKGKMSNFGVQLREKQKVRRVYGLLERQFRKYYLDAARQKGNTGLNILHTLERRLDSVVYRMGFAASRSEARMWVNHGHFAINGKNVNVASQLVEEGDEVSFVAKSPKLKQKTRDICLQMRRGTPWCEVQPEELKGRFARLPNREELDSNIRENLIVEHYSR